MDVLKEVSICILLGFHVQGTSFDFGMLDKHEYTHYIYFDKI